MLNFSKLNGLIPAVIQDFESKEVLMLGFMNEEAYKKTLEDKKVWFFSRTKQRLWMKGEESGNVLHVMQIATDCDNDSLLVLVKPEGNTCHTGSKSCFNLDSIDILNLFKLIEKRKTGMSKGSYTRSLFTEGQSRILEKVEEESLEVLKASRHETKERLVEESCDLLYHLFVLLAYSGIKIDDLNWVLRKRNSK